jgi:hypothetical protein
MPDPNLLAAMEEIKAILSRRDIVGSVILASGSDMEFLRHLQASWNALALEEDGLLRLRCKRADYPDAAAWTEALSLSIGTIAGLVDAMQRDMESYLNLLPAIGEQIEFQHLTRAEPPPP